MGFTTSRKVAVPIQSSSVTNFRKNLRQNFFQRFPIGGRGFPTTAEAQDVRNFTGLETHRGQDMRGLFLAGGAGGAGADGKAGFVEAVDPALLAALRHERGDGVPQTRHARAHNGGPGHLADKQFLEFFLPLGAGLVVSLGELLFANFERGEHRDDDRDVFRASALAAFLLATVEQWVDAALVSRFEETHAARTAEFVRGAAEVVAIAEAFGGQFADPLNGVAKNGTS